MTPFAGADSIYEYATIPYEELLSAYHQQRQQQQQQKRPYSSPHAGIAFPANGPFPGQCVSNTTSTINGRPIPTPRLNNDAGMGQLPYGGEMPMPLHSAGQSCFYKQFIEKLWHLHDFSSASPRLLHSISPGISPAQLATLHRSGNNYEGTPGPALANYSTGPYPVRLSMIGQQQVVFRHPHQTMNGGGMFANNISNQSAAVFDMPMPPILEMGKLSFCRVFR